MAEYEISGNEGDGGFMRTAAMENATEMENSKGTGMKETEKET
jgi:hypothetical protein